MSPRRVLQERDRLAGICSQFLGKGQLVSLEGRLQTRRWEDERKVKHYRTEIVASAVEMLSGRRRKDYAAETAARALETQAGLMGIDPVDGADLDELAEDLDEIDDGLDEDLAEAPSELEPVAA